MSSASSTKRHLISPPGEEDQEHRPCDPKKTRFDSLCLNPQKGNIQENAVVNDDLNYPHEKKSNENPNIHLNENLVKDYLLFDCPKIPETDNIHDGNEQIQQLKGTFKKQTEYQDKKKFFSQIMKLTSDIEDIDVARPGEAMQSLLKDYRQKHKGREKQFAFTVVFFKNGRYEILPEAYPVHANKKSASSSTKRHSEEILIEKIKYLLQKGANIQIILIYSYNSPCCKREMNNDPCMFQLLDCAIQWYHEYGIITAVVFTKFYGLSGPNVFRNLTYSDISTSNVFYPYIETWKEISYSLDCEDLREEKNNFYKEGIDQYLMCVEATDRGKLKAAIRSTLNDLIEKAESKSVCLREKHLDDGFEIINSFPFDPKVKDQICEIWEKVVDNSSPIKEKITTDFNTGIVKLFAKYLRDSFGNHSPLHLYQLKEE